MLCLRGNLENVETSEIDLQKRRKSRVVTGQSTSTTWTLVIIMVRLVKYDTLSILSRVQSLAAALS